jgi:hypothetical protein
MAIDHKMRGAPTSPVDAESKFGYGVRELREAAAVKELSLDMAPRKPAGEKRGFDPYNTSGSFDRTKNWARVGKR